jgi:MFS family permease
MTDAIMSVAMVGRLCIGAVYSVIILHTSELFPTVNRNTAVGTSSTMSHVGSLAAPYIVDLLVSFINANDIISLSSPVE